MSDWTVPESEPMVDVDKWMRTVATSADPPLYERTGILRMSGATLDRLRSEMAASGSDLSPEEAADLIAKAHGFRDGRIELFESLGRRGQQTLRLVD